MSDSKDTKMQPFQVLEPERKKQQNDDGYNSKQFQGKCIDPRLLTFCITNFFFNVGVSQIAPFYPALAHNEAELSYSQIGLVFGINPLGSIIFSLVIGTFISMWGRKRSLMCALLVQTCVQTLFGCLNFMTGNKALFFTVSLLTRILQGMSRSVYATVTFAYIPLFWPGEFQKKLGIMESMTALGLLFGPIIGSFLNYIFGYSVPFFLIASIFLLAQIPIYMHMPPDNTLKSFERKKKLPIGRAFKSIKVIVTIMNVLSITCGFVYIGPIFVNHMAAFGYSENIAAIVLTIPALFYVILVNIVPRLQKLVKKTFLMSLSLVICFAGNMIEAPFWGSDNTIIPVIFGLMLVGTAQAFSMLPSIPQITEFLGPVINDPQFKNNLTDMASALFIMSMGIGQLIGQFLGGVIYDKFGGNINLEENPELAAQEKKAFKNALICLGIWQLFAGCMFFFFGDGYKGWQDLFRRCAKGQEQEIEATIPLIREKDSSGDSTDNEILSDSDSNISDQEIKKYKQQTPTITKKIKIRKEVI